MSDGVPPQANREALRDLHRWYQQQGREYSNMDGQPLTGNLAEVPSFMVERPPLAPEGSPWSISEISLDPLPGKKYTPSPETWEDESAVYSFLWDRFNPSEESMPLGDPAHGATRHGGTIRGAREKLAYLHSLGITTVMISPVLMNYPHHYHGYAPINLFAVDPALGTMEDLKDFVDEAHRLGIRVVMDLLVNHMGPVFNYVRPGVAENELNKWIGLERQPNEIGWVYPFVAPVEMRDPSFFDRRGVIDDWDDASQATYGDFMPNFRHFASHDPYTQSVLINIMKWWLKETDVDGFRWDAVRHVDTGFVQRAKSETRDYAATSLGKTNVLFIDENASGRDGDVAPSLDPAGKGKGQNSAYAYPPYRRTNAALHGAEPTRILEVSLQESLGPIGHSIHLLLRFLGNHDVYRFLRPGQPVEMLHMALGYLMLSIGIPMLYYGDEQAFRDLHDKYGPENPKDPADPDNRADMFAGQFKPGAGSGDSFNVESLTFKFIQKLIGLRRQFIALRRGEQYVRFSEDRPGIFAFSRIYKGEEHVVVLNTSGEERVEDVLHDDKLNRGAIFYDALDPDVQAASRVTATGSKIRVSMPPYGVRVFIRKPRDYSALRQVAQLRRDYPVLKNGNKHPRSVEGSSVHVVSLINSDSEAVIVQNRTGELQSAEFWVDASISPNATFDLVSPTGAKIGQTARAYPSEGGWKVAVSLIPYQTLILVRQTQK